MFKELLIAYTPQNLYYRIRCNKNFKHWNMHNTIFVHIPKNGGTTESIAKYGEFLGHVPFVAIEKKFARVNGFETILRILSRSSRTLYRLTTMQIMEQVK